MSEKEFNIDEILGLNSEEIIKSAGEKSGEIMETPCEIVPKTSEELEEKLITDTNNITGLLDGAIQDIILQISASPADAELVDSLSKLLKSRAVIAKPILDVYLNKEKFKQNVAITSMKLTSQKQINSDNNATRLTLKREEIMKEVAKKREEERAKRTVDAETIENSEESE